MFSRKIWQQSVTKFDQSKEPSCKILLGLVFTVQGHCDAVGRTQENQRVLLVLGGHVAVHQHHPAMAAGWAKRRWVLRLPGRAGSHRTESSNLHKPGEWQPVRTTRWAHYVYILKSVNAHVFLHNRKKKLHAWVMPCLRTSWRERVFSSVTFLSVLVEAAQVDCHAWCSFLLQMPHVCLMRLSLGWYWVHKKADGGLNGFVNSYEAHYTSCCNNDTF